MQVGINLNPRAPSGMPANVSELSGSRYVRMVFSVDASRQTLPEAFAFYDSVIGAYNANDTAVILIINQETQWGNGPWDHGNWALYASGLATTCAQIAEHYKAANVVYQLWNEGDIKGMSSVYVAPSDFALVIKACVPVLARHSKQVIMGGLASGAGDAINYVRLLEAHYGGKLPFTALAVHPYGQYVGSQPPPIPTGWFGRLPDALKLYTQMGYDLWVTEFGVSEDGGFPPNTWRAIADYMLVCVNTFKQYPRVKVAIWFAWSDIMRGAGIVDTNNQPKQPIYAQYQMQADGSTPIPPTPPTQAGDLRVIAAALNIRNGPGTNFAVIARVNAGDTLTALEGDACRDSKVGKQDQWLNVRTASGVSGYAAAWYLALIP